ncbi:MAG: class I SAM-dependent RNA methyltransferase [Pikeienuella sp.]|uniref:class I SAM-dependent RNA methyltransferase n=1 Tax=Pikeienuella sp. TaxID=2831957 RepID=UPI00391D00C9
MSAELEIVRLGAAGDGEADGGVFVAFALPGERVRGVVEGGRMAALEILRPSPERAPPPCRHFGACGGCALQHASGHFLAGWKRDRIAEALARRGIEGVEIRETRTSPPRSRRRAVFAARRTKTGALAGFHGRRSGEIAALEDCHLVAPPLLGALEAARGLARIGGSRKGELRVTATLSEGGLDLSVEGGKPLDPAFWGDLVALAEEADLARLAWNGEIVASRRPAFHRFGAALVEPPPGGFLQATREGEVALLEAAREALGPAKRIADLFAGSGAFALPLAEQAEVLAVEGETAMVAALDAGWRAAPGLKRVVARARDLFRRPLLAPELAALDGAVIDPPRAGAAAQCEELAKAGPERLAMLSCEPATFARDARTLIDGGYQMDWVVPVDQFLWSGHVELAAAFRRR